MVLKGGVIFYKYSGINNSIYKNLKQESYEEAKAKIPADSKIANSFSNE